MPTKQEALEAALAQIVAAFGKRPPTLRVRWLRAKYWLRDLFDLPSPQDEADAEEDARWQAAEDRRQAAWNAMTKEEQDASWAEWEAKNCPNGVPF